MASYVTGIVVALAAVFGLYATLELAAGNSLFSQERFGNTSTEKLIEICKDKRSSDRIEAIVQLGKRPKELDATFSVIAPLTMDRDELIKTAAESALSDLGKPAAPYVKSYFDFEALKLADEKIAGVRPNRDNQSVFEESFKLRENHLIACSCIRAIGDGCEVYICLLYTSDAADE